MIESIEKKLVELQRSVQDAEAKHGVDGIIKNESKTTISRDGDTKMEDLLEDSDASSESGLDVPVRSLQQQNCAASAQKILHKLLLRDTHKLKSSNEKSSDEEFEMPKITANSRRNQTESSWIAKRRPARIASAQEAFFDLSSSSESEENYEQGTLMKNQRLSRRKITGKKPHVKLDLDLTLIASLRRTHKQTQRFGCLVNDDDVDKILDCPSNVLTWTMTDDKEDNEDVPDEASDKVSDEASDESDDSFEIESIQSYSESRELLNRRTHHKRRETSRTFTSNTPLRKRKRGSRAGSKDAALDTKRKSSVLEDNSDSEIDETDSECQILTARKRKSQRERLHTMVNKKE